MNPSPLGFGSSCHWSHLLPPALPPSTLLSAELLRCHSSRLSSGHGEAVSLRGLSGREGGKDAQGGWGMNRAIKAPWEAG